ncbi:DNA integrity scanning protein DisA nucleotide-binding domain protein [Desulfopila inferna]|nr:DNA integrity scanning protein DisA nucleotide-binding domain protein [Desulfopila inferna]
MQTSFNNTCINDTLMGLREGLSHFSGPSTAAVIFSLPKQAHLSIYDPDSLLRGHELKIKNFYFDEKGHQFLSRYNGTSKCYSSIENVPVFELDGILSFGGSSATVPYQMWFTEHHPDLCSTGPTERWLEHAVLRFSHDIANGPRLYTGISGSFLREYSTHAIHDHIKKETFRLTGKLSGLDVYPILDAILEISKTLEERAWPSGELAFIEPRDADKVNFLAKFTGTELPQLSHSKHVRKLLQTVQDTNHKLISDGQNILGICNSRLPQYSLTAAYHRRYGYVRLNQDILCSFSDGRYRSSSFKAKLFEIEEALLDYDLDSETRDKLFHIITTLVHSAQSMRHGCAFVLDLNSKPVKISGQLLDAPLDLNDDDSLELACALSRVDGALHISQDQRLLGFACLLDGRTIEGEDRARGARYNSALRFTAENHKTIVVVVSSDRPVSVIQQGIVLQGRCQWRSMTHCSLVPDSLKEWLAVSA